jgi:hypothetical protein
MEFGLCVTNAEISQSRQLIENKGSKERFFSSQSRYITEKKSIYSKFQKQ